jgi:hypothetical protein
MLGRKKFGRCNWRISCWYFCISFVKLGGMLLTRIGKASFWFKVSTADRIFSTSNTRPYSTLETVVIGKKLAIRTRNLMQSPNLIESFSQRYRNTPQKQNHQSPDTETANKNSHRVIFSRYRRRKKEEGRRKKALRRSLC